ncbi:hypothetical protein CCACVL1_05194 [Corchorus capsularis]|uniref:Uncharacterized protein n=1 Tax=Corchorus capsularis TaxID=210143 RepID=A0A1R3JM46_COCAP|nr:hypothetical protein CCACVL1_05194 [Corchorus capsularis]
MACTSTDRTNLKRLGKCLEDFTHFLTRPPKLLIPKVNPKKLVKEKATVAAAGSNNKTEKCDEMYGQITT